MSAHSNSTRFPSPLAGVQLPPLPARLTEGFLRHVLGWFLPVKSLTNLELTPSQHTESTSSASPTLPLPSELVEKIHFLLNRENWQTAREEGEMYYPVLDEALHQFQQQLNREVAERGWLLLRKLPWPRNLPLAVALTHDVDLTRDVGPKHLISLFFKGHWQHLGSELRALQQGRNRYWTFPQLMELYQRHQWPVTFFFLAKRWEGTHYRYNIRSRRFRQLLRELMAQGHEIGLHSSRYAQSHPRRIVKEKQRLEQVLGEPVKGVRQHYLNLSFPEAWEHFSAAGFRYDSSLASNRTPGFVGGTSFPFQPLPSRQTASEDFFEIPFSIMDYNWALLKSSSLTPETYFSSLTQRLKNVQGLLNLLWHPSNLAEVRFQPLWQMVIQWLEENTVYLNTLQGILSWWQARATTEIQSVKVRENRYLFRFTARQPVDGLTLEVVTSRPFKVRGQDARLILPEGKFPRIMLEKFPAGTREVELIF